MYVCESWTIKKTEHWRIDTFEFWCWRRLFRVPWTSRRSNQSILKEISSEYSFGMIDAEVESPIAWPTDAKSRHIGKDSDAGKGWRQKVKRVAEDNMIRSCHRLNGYESEQIQGGSEGQRSLACCSPWGCKEWDMTWHLNNKNNPFIGPQLSHHGEKLARQSI